MTRSALLHLAWPLVGLGGLLAGACLASIWYINRLQADLGDSLRGEAATLQAAQEMQIQLRQLRFHTLMLAADPAEDRRRQGEDDRRQLEGAIAALRRQPLGPEDRADLDAVEHSYHKYLADLAPGEAGPPGFASVADLVHWANEHPVRQLLAPCRRLVQRSEARMTGILARSEEQSRWAGRALLIAGLVGPLAGLAAGYAVARGLSRRVAELSVRVRAVQAHLDQDVGEMTLQAPPDLGELDRQLERVVGRVKEVCERLQTQEREILRSEQLAAVGHLAAGVAHEVRNPLTGIKLLIEAALRPDGPTQLTREDLELIRGEIARLERTAQGLLDYAKPARPNPRPLDLRELVARSADLLHPRAERQRVALLLDLPPAPLVAAVDPDQFATLLSNLLLNALDATPPGGEVTVRAEESAAGVRLAVADTGPGIDPAVADRLFTPFATTKPTGTGLGLALAGRVARDHGGELTAANRPGGGACFTVTLPRRSGRW